MGASKQDVELTLLLTKLYTIQEQVGAKEKSSDEEKKNRAEQSGQVTMGKGKKGKKTGSRFLELKSSIVDNLKSVHALIEEQSASKRNNPKEAIAAQAEIRELIRQASDEWSELNDMYKKEARKKKSKFTLEELEVQQALVMQLNQEIEKVKEAQLAGYGRGGATEQNMQLNLGALAALDAADLSNNDGSNTKAWTPGTSGTAMTGSQQVQIQQIRDRDAEFDQDLDELGEGIQDLHELALRQGEEVQRQNAMLTNTTNRIDNAYEHMENVNAKMKDTLNEVGRSSDKLCVDIMCILLVVGFGGVFYKMSKGEF
mmetsp:Transcript_28679/g.51832  ORF Transcript_28679/g.51832 Transcript_28679/m.51832 type:complete len:314 (-) Transcript_28679:116-1057(-)|eukprot:CAMPEP_0201883012 /NCGR_PEP_ID=MMETSP0902-20130614/15093_1 /ASSEMBLY_ACC=CAM_ASM_000551 /TAXON_ID=420261 /ORGANISM="Thalassiosira antarctica, Strain CCMP982" /LENGTH=313 /DNA_ID=CAMNT_0048411709 /DNA_START=138 /DNA_END=1079 /DNA_ORIENTATION=-